MPWSNGAAPRLGRDDNYAAWRTMGLPRSSARHESDNDSWADRKARVVARFGLSSPEVVERHVRDNPDFFSLFALSPQDYAPFGEQYRSTYAVPWWASLRCPAWRPRRTTRSPSTLCAEAIRQTA